MTSPRNSAADQTSLHADPSYLAALAGLEAGRAEERPIELAKCSIAVLPFNNISGDPEQDYFADGIVEDIITALSRFGTLFVIARNSSFTYKGRAVDVKQVGRDLSVRYVLEGSVRKVANRVRITGQLIDAATGAHLWAEHFDGEIEDIFDLQDKVTAKVVSAIAPMLEQAEFDSKKFKATTVLSAYDCFIRGMAHYNRWTRDGSEEALTYFYKAIKLDPEYATPYGMAARCFVQRKANQFTLSNAADRQETERLCRMAGSLGKNDAVALGGAGHALGFVVGDVETGGAYLNRAVALNPNLTVALIQSGWNSAWGGDCAGSVALLQRALQLSPRDHYLFSIQSALALAFFLAGDDAQAIRYGEAAIKEQITFVPSYCSAAAALALSGDQDKAQALIRRLQAVAPSLNLKDVQDDFFYFLEPTHKKRWRDGLRLAWAES